MAKRKLGLVLAWGAMAVLGMAGWAADVAATQPSGGGPKIVLIIRHAEKPEGEEGKGKDPNLTAKGYQRADALAKVIPANFPRPDFLIATKKSKSSNRPAETITPLGAALHEPVDATLKKSQVDDLVHELLTDKKYDGKVVLIAWHHEEIPDIAKALGAKDAAGQVG